MPGKRVGGRSHCDKRFERIADCLRGGAVASLLDAVMTNCMLAHGLAAMTGELKGRFQRPAVAGKPAIVGARIDRSSGCQQVMKAAVPQEKAVKAVACGRSAA